MSDVFRVIREDRNKAKYMPLLLVGDESKSMIYRYLDDGILYVGYLDNIAIAVCVIVVCGDDCIEVKNLAVEHKYRRKGYGSAILGHIHSLYSKKNIILGTGETPSTLNFYRSCGYEYSHLIQNFFTDNYPSPIIEDGIVLKDMIYLKRKNTL